MTSRSPSSATISSSPTRRRKLRATMAKPCDSRKAAAEFSARDPAWRRSIAVTLASVGWRGHGVGGIGAVQRHGSAGLDAHPLELASDVALRVDRQCAREALWVDGLTPLQRAGNAERVISESEQPAATCGRIAEGAGRFAHVRGGAGVI